MEKKWKKWIDFKAYFLRKDFSLTDLVKREDTNYEMILDGT